VPPTAVTYGDVAGNEGKYPLPDQDAPDQYAEFEADEDVHVLQVEV
jgi:hypothetical protein